MLAIAPDDFDAHLAMAHALLSQGEFPPGWIEYEWRLRSPLHQGVVPRMIRPAWNGMMLPGKRLLLVADQGFGDAFHFSRYVPLAAARCAGVVVLCRAAQASLFARLDGARACVTDMAEVGEHAAFAWLGSLQRGFGNVPAMVPYLSPEPARRPPGARTARGIRDAAVPAAEGRRLGHTNPAAGGGAERLGGGGC